MKFLRCGRSKDLRYSHSLWLTLATLLVATVAAQNSGQSLDVELQRATQKEMVTGDLKAAISEYERIVARAATTNRALAAQALTRMAESYQKLGDAESKRIYARIVREYADQAEYVVVARTRLGQAERGRPAQSVTLRKVWDGDYSGSISYDGQRLSYNDWATGNLAVRELQQGTNHPITASDYNVFESAISRDGTRVAYPWINPSGKLELRITDVPGATVMPSGRLFASDEVSWIRPMDWSPDGKLLAVSIERRDQSAQIALVTVPEGSLRVLKSVDWRGPTRIFFSPDGRALGFDLPESESNDQRDVFVLAVDGGRQVDAVVHPSQDVMMGWSPDGKHLLFASDRQGGSMGLWAVPIGEGKPGTPAMVKPSIGTGWSLGATANGSLYMGTRAGDGDVAVVSIDLATGKQLGSPARPIQRFVGSNTQPHWSADGKLLAYTSSRGFNPASNRDRVLVVQSVETGNVRELRPRLSYFNQFNWSSDGRSFVTGGTDLKGRSGVFRIDAQTGEVSSVVLTPAGGNAYPQFSPDGTRIYYRNWLGADPPNGPARHTIVERDVTTGRERQVIDDRVTNGPINLSPDGLWIAMGIRIRSAASSLATAIVLIPVDGGEPREMLRAGESENFANFQGMPSTPDGRGFLVRKNRGRIGELWFVPVAGEPRKLDVDLSQWGSGPVGAFSLHPDGRQLAFLQVSSRPAAEVWVLENFLSALK